MLGRRLLAITYEAFLLLALVYGAGFVWLLATRNTPLMHQAWLLQFIEGGVIWGYFVFQWKKGQTLPMKALKLRWEKPPTWRQVNCYFVLSALLMHWLGLGQLSLLTDQLTWAERLCGLRLIKENS